MNNESINYRNKKKVHSTNNKLKIAGATAVLAGALFAVPNLVSADTWKANTPNEIAANITNTSSPYTIKYGDSLWGISEALKTKGLTVTPDQLASQNNIANADLIYAGNSLTFNGQTVTAPSNSGGAPTSQPTPAGNVDKSSLEAKLQEANKYLYTNGVYTEGSLDNLRQAAMRGNGVIKSDAATQQDVTNAVNNISQAINGLQKQ